MHLMATALPRLLTGLLLATAAHAEPLPDNMRFDVSRQGDDVLIDASATAVAPLATTWRVLVGYDELPRFIPGMQTSRAMQRSGEDALVTQTGVARWGVFRQKFSVTLRVHEDPLRTVSAEAVAGDFSVMHSRYELAQGDTPGSTRLVYRARLQPRDGIPPLIGLHVMGEIAKKQFAALLGEIERQGRD
jgi:hypothetical protein